VSPHGGSIVLVPHVGDWQPPDPTETLRGEQFEAR
jgi:hypothetical protein